MKIGDKIRSAREALEMSQDAVSSLIPMNQSSYSKIERDMQEPSLHQLKRICEILSLSPEYLLSLNRYENVTERDTRFIREIKKLYEKYYIQ